MVRPLPHKERNILGLFSEGSGKTGRHLNVFCHSLIPLDLENFDIALSVQLQNGPGYPRDFPALIRSKLLRPLHQARVYAVAKELGLEQLAKRSGALLRSLQTLHCIPQ